MLGLGLVGNTPKSFKVVLFGDSSNDDGVLKGIPYKKGDVFKDGFSTKLQRGSIFDKGTNWFGWTDRGTYNDEQD